jgi:hypothetical protein
MATWIVFMKGGQVVAYEFFLNEYNRTKLSYPQKQIASDCACFKYDVLPPR